MHKAGVIDPSTRQSLIRLLIQASIAWWKGRMEETSVEHSALGRKQHKNAQMTKWAEALTDYATAQLYSQMVITKLK
jgi:hypothetical protein